MPDPIETPENQDPPEITLENVVETPIEELKDEQKTFIQEHAEELTDEQKETYKAVLEEKKEEGEPEIPDPETRTPAEIKKAKKGKEEEDEDEGEDEDEEITPEDEKTISKIIDKKTSGVLSKLQKIENQTDVDAFINSKPEFGKYRSAALKYMEHPAYSNIPVHNIMAIVASKDLQKIGAEKERKAAKDAAGTHSPGTTVREPGKGGKVDWSKASKEEVAAKRAEILGQQG